jgi:transcriptional regulator with XRE-family HTH domain
MTTNEFNALVAASGWSQAEIARQLQITPGAVSQLCSGATRPRAATLNLLRMILGREKPQALRNNARVMTAAWENRLLARLRGLPAAERDPLLGVFHKMIDLLPSARRRGV